MKIKSLHIYPVKGCQGIDLNEMRIGEDGPQWDRQWMIVDENGLFLTQRQHPKMALIQTRRNEEDLSLSFASKSFGVVAQEEIREVEIWGQTLKARVAETELNESLSEFLGQSVQLVEFADRREKEKNGHQGRLKFADGYPLLMVGTASLEALNERLKNPITMDRFRPNIVIETGEAFLEDGLGEFVLGDLPMLMAKKCERCIVINVDQQTAIRKSEPLRVLTSFRRQDGKVQFGVNLIALKTGVLKVGDELKR